MCQHKNTFTVQTGNQFVSCGEYDDNIQEQAVCLDCGEVVTGESVPDEVLEY